MYDRARFAENARELQAALAGTGLPFRLRFALKANPHPEILSVFRALGAPGTPESVGIDACSPGEVLRALECGWRPDEISYTGTNVSERDLDVLLAHGDPLQPRRDQPGRALRPTRAGDAGSACASIPAAGAGYNEHLEYSGARPTKFGIGLERLRRRAGGRPPATTSSSTRSTSTPARAGWRDGLAGFERALPAAVEAVERARAAGHPIDGGQRRRRAGRPARDDEQPVDLDAYAAVLARHLGRSASPSPASRATSCPRTPASCSARS